MPEGAQCTPSPPLQPLTPIEKAGLILTGVVTTVGIIAAEVTLVIIIIIEVAVLELGPVGSITTGEKQPVILLPPWGLEK